MRVGVEVLSGGLLELDIFECFHLMHQADWNVPALAGFEYETFDAGDSLVRTLSLPLGK